MYVDLGTDWLAGKRRFTKAQRQTDPIGPFNYVQVLSTKGVGADDYHIALKRPPTEPPAPLPTRNGLHG